MDAAAYVFILFFTSPTLHFGFAKTQLYLPWSLMKKEKKGEKYDNSNYKLLRTW